MSIVKSSDVKGKEGRPGVIGKTLLNQDVGAGAYTMGEILMKPGAVIPMHTHFVEEAFYVVEGSGLFRVGDQEVEGGPGTAALAPAGVPHGLENNTKKDWKLTFHYPAVNVTAKFMED